eukprot:TRINITY_DN20359_c0_g1_i1.p1 TRINITY_DN20359_c0_g1~~TRINITY_DN20359_c0_g1_i1.p1  ORF type:complete len:107 (+),score=1.69 TRINITY_DN20359_c0_g1_i1:39-323(+)
MQYLGRLLFALSFLLSCSYGFLIQYACDMDCLSSDTCSGCSTVTIINVNDCVALDCNNYYLKYDGNQLQLHNEATCNSFQSPERAVPDNSGQCY